ncbi:MAG: hypothetical protein JWQ72_2000, partial [Polaromonas sp.]|nr:hypothetical protein [Polaromonas sp.]
DEGKRPQTVAEFRAALVGSEASKTQRQPTTRPTGDQTRTQSLLAFAANSQSIPQSQTDSLRKNVLGTIMFLDLVAYSTYSMEQQVAAKQHFNDLINKAIKGVEESSRIVIDTGDGAAVCFLGDPEEALQSALLMRGLLLQKYGQSLSVRIGLHMGPIRMVFDINQRVNVVGDGINVAQRIMDFAQPNQIVVSRAYYDVVSRITDTAASLFRSMGPHLDKHLRSHDIYSVLDPQSAPAPQASGADHAFDKTASFATLRSFHELTPEIAGDIETELARLIGPLAKVLVKKALSRAVSAQALRELVSVSIPDAAAREAFVKVRSTTASATQSGASAGSRFRADVSRPSQPASTSVRQPSRFADSRPVSLPQQNLSLEQLALLDQVLSQYIGPMARMIIRKEASRHLTLAALLPALALHIDKVDDRSKFLAFMQKSALPSR